MNNMVKRCNESENQLRKRSLPENRKTLFFEEEEDFFCTAGISFYSPGYVHCNAGYIVCGSDCTDGEPGKMTGRPEYTKGSPVSRPTAGKPEYRNTSGDTGKFVGSPECTNVNAGKNVGKQDWINGSLELVSGIKELTSGYQELVNSSQEWTSGYQELVNSSQKWNIGSPAMNKSSPSWKSPAKAPIYSPDSSGNKETENECASEKEQHLRPKRRGSGQTFLLTFSCCRFMCVVTVFILSNVGASLIRIRIS